MELLYARAANLNQITLGGEDNNQEDSGIYKHRYEHAIRELEFTKRKMAQQHEDDLEQLVGLKNSWRKSLLMLTRKSRSNGRESVSRNEESKNFMARCMTYGCFLKNRLFVIIYWGRNSGNFNC
ncbi:uncharacterized protein LOC141530078 [Cotesia typhae]|uniref:uncharacterized protein LOC141530078 n=1 Tax=Cotesia typhae TaxID=2053667 RepID=UPI003D68AFEB